VSHLFAVCQQEATQLPRHDPEAELILRRALFAIGLTVGIVLVFLFALFIGYFCCCQEYLKKMFTFKKSDPHLRSKRDRIMNQQLGENNAAGLIRDQASFRRAEKGYAVNLPDMIRGNSQSKKPQELYSIAYNVSAN